MARFTEDRSTFVCHTNELIDVRFVSLKDGFLRANLASGDKNNMEGEEE